MSHRTKNYKPLFSKRLQSIGWFVGIYLASVATYALIALLLHGLVSAIT